MKSLDPDSEELQENKNESCVDAHGFPLVTVTICITVLKNCLGVQMSECVLGSKRFSDPFNWAKKNIWVDEYSCIPNIQTDSVSSYPFLQT